MKVVILAGGLGSRLSEYTNLIPKPMVIIGSKPIIEHIMDTYTKYGYNEFIIALGYKGHIIKEYFDKNSNGKKIQYINTGVKTLTGLRLKKIEKYINNNNFFLTYGDGLSNVNIEKLYKFHLRNKKNITITAVRPPARFGEIKINGNIIKSFIEKNNISQGWINGGYMVVNKNFFNFLTLKNEMLEREPFLKAVKSKSMSAFRHYDFWQCMDNVRDKKILDKLSKNKTKPWLV